LTCLLSTTWWTWSYQLKLGTWMYVIHVKFELMSIEQQIASKLRYSELHCVRSYPTYLILFLKFSSVKVISKLTLIQLRGLQSPAYNYVKHLCCIASLRPKKLSYTPILYIHTQGVHINLWYLIQSVQLYISTVHIHRMIVNTSTGSYQPMISNPVSIHVQLYISTVQMIVNTWIKLWYLIQSVQLYISTVHTHRMIVNQWLV